MAEKNCGTCKWLRVPPGEKRIKHRVYHCDYPLPALPALPASITRAYGYRPPRKEDQNMMCPSYGVDCPTWERLPKKGKPNA